MKSLMSGNGEYTVDFFSGISNGSLRSARAVAPLVYELTPIESVLDVGCGTGAWLRGFQECGVTRLAGIDGDYVDRSQLVIDSKNFTACDLASAVALPTGFDLVVCMEVLEHLPDAAGRRLVRLMTRSAPLILFSAAVPGQGGTHHINERWHDHWHRQFAQHGFRVIDCLRSRIYDNREVEVWYRQNAFLYAGPQALIRWPALEQLGETSAVDLLPIAPRILAQLTSIRGLTYHLGVRLKQKLFG